MLANERFSDDYHPSKHSSQQFNKEAQANFDLRAYISSSPSMSATFDLANRTDYARNFIFSVSEFPLLLDWRRACINCIILLADSYCIQDQISALAITIADRYIAVKMQNKRIQDFDTANGIAAVCFTLSIKMIGNDVPSLSDLSAAASLGWSSEKVEQTEINVVIMLDWDLYSATGMHPACIRIPENLSFGSLEPDSDLSLTASV